MKIRINVKAASRRRPGIRQLVFEYPDGPMQAGTFLEETVRRCVKDYNERKEAGAVLGVFSQEALEDMAAGGKVSFGDPLSEKKADPEKAVQTAREAFADGLVALFADGTRFEDPDQVLPLRDGSEVTFVRLTFLAGRMW